MTIRTPSKLAIGQAVRVTDRASVADYRNRMGLITEAGPERREYRVEFEDGRTPTTGYLPANWLEPLDRPARP